MVGEGPKEPPCGQSDNLCPKSVNTLHYMILGVELCALGKKKYVDVLTPGTSECDFI